MVHKKLTAALLVALAGSTLAVSPAFGLGLGEIQVRSAQGQPLHAEVAILSASPTDVDSMILKSTAPDEYIRHGLAYVPGLSTLKINLETRGNRLVGVLQTAQPINEPYINVILEGEAAGGRMRRVYTLLLNPSVVGAKQAQRASEAAAEKNKASAAKTPDLNAAAPEVVKKVVEPRIPQHYSLDTEKLENERRQKNQVTEADPSTPALALKVVDIVMYSNIVEQGKREVPAPVQTSGKAQPVTKALSQVVPKGWRGIAADSGVKSPAKVTWKKEGQSWMKVMDAMLSEANLFATVNWDAKEVIFRSVEPPQSVETVKTEPAKIPAPTGVEKIAAAGNQSTPATVIPDNVKKDDVSTLVQPKKPATPDEIAVAVAAVRAAKEKSVQEKPAESAPAAASTAAAATPVSAPVVAVAAPAVAPTTVPVQKPGIVTPTFKQEVVPAPIKITLAGMEPVDASKKAEVAAYRSLEVIAPLQPTDAARMVHASGKNVNIIFSLYEMAPPDWTVISKIQQASRNNRITWVSPGLPWLVALDGALGAAGLYATIDGAKQEIVIVRRLAPRTSH